MPPGVSMVCDLILRLHSLSFLSVDLHLGKTDGVEERLAKHVGTMLTPPSSPERASELPPWTARDVTVQGKGWDQSSVDISIAGIQMRLVNVPCCIIIKNQCSPCLPSLSLLR